MDVILKQRKAPEDTTVVINGLQVADIDAGSNNVELTLSVLNGTVTVSGGGVTVTGNNSNSVKLTGTIANINSGQFGRITTQAGTPRIIQLGMKYAF